MARKLRNVKLDEISFVGKGDNPEANVLLLKMKSEEDNPKGDCEMTPEEIAALKKAKEEADAKVAELTKQAETLATEKAASEKALSDKEKEFEEMKAKNVKKEDEDVLKGLPESIVKEIQDNRERISKMEDEAATREYVAKAAEVVLVGKADAIGDLLKSIAKHDSKLAAQVFDLFKTADARIKEGDLLKEAGSSSSDTTGTSAYDKIVAKAAELRKSSPELSEAKAFTKVYDSDAELRTAYLKEREGK